MSKIDLSGSAKFSMVAKMEQTLELKIRTYDEVCRMFNDGEVTVSNRQELNKNKIELNAQIKLLTHLLAK